MGRSRGRRRVLIAAIVVGALAGAAVIARHAFLNDTAQAVDTEEALQRFRSQSTVAAPMSTATVESDAPTPAAASVVEPGVYRYATEGSEGIDVLGGTRHPYPAETSITVSPAGCGVSLHWDLLVERHEEWRLCAASDGVVLQTTGAFYHEFFAHGSLEAMTCNTSVLLVPTDGLRRDPVPQRCTLNEREWLPVWEVLGRDTRIVDGEQVPVTHVRMTIDDEDEYYEHVVADYWLDDRGLPVSMSATKTSKSSSGLVGDVVYDESYRAELVTAIPLR